MNLRHLAILLLGFTSTAHSQAFVCIDTDGDGYGWDGTRTCVVSDCVDTDGDGWGWNGTKSCRLSERSPASLATCIDTDGDGWGWNGHKSCVVSERCVDTDGDGWGWNSTGSCVVNTIDSAIELISNFDTISGGGTVQYLDGSYYARIQDSRPIATIWRLATDSPPAIVSGPAIYPSTEPFQLLTFDKSIVWWELGPSGSMVLKRLDDTGFVNEICTNDFADNGSCIDSSIEVPFLFTSAVGNVLLTSSLTIAPVEILDKGSNTTRTLLSPSGEPLNTFTRSVETKDSIFITAGPDSSASIFRADLDMQNLTEITDPEGSTIGGVGIGYATSNYYVNTITLSKDVDPSGTPRIILCDGGSSACNEIVVDVNEGNRVSIFGTSANRIFIGKGDNIALYSIDENGGNEVKHSLYHVSRLEEASMPKYSQSTFFTACETTERCAVPSVYMIREDSVIQKVTSDDVPYYFIGTYVVRDNTFYYIYNGQLIKFDADNGRTVINTGHLEALHLMGSDEQGVYFKARSALFGGQIYVIR